MKVSKRDIYLSIILLGLIAIALSYFIGVKKLNTRTEELEAENRNLRSESQVLEEIQIKQKQYMQDNQSMMETAAIFTALFPSEVREEDQIMYASRIENMVGCYFSYVATPTTSYLDIPKAERENKLAPLTDITGAIAAHSTVNPANMLDASGMLLGCASSDNVFGCTYDQFKDMVTYITGDPRLKSIDNITLSYDSTTGNLTGNMTINYYTLTGTGASYSEPDTHVIGHGVDCIFGSLALEPETDGAQESVQGTE